MFAKADLNAAMAWSLASRHWAAVGVCAGMATGSSSSKAAARSVIGSFRPAARSIRIIDRTAAMIAMI
jgi:hypothetical protein